MLNALFFIVHLFDFIIDPHFERQNVLMPSVLCHIEKRENYIVGKMNAIEIK